MVRASRFKEAFLTNMATKWGLLKAILLVWVLFFLRVDDKTEYHAQISFTNRDSITTYQLPKVAAKGSILSVDRVRNRIRVQVRSSTLDKSIFIKASCRGVDHYLIEGTLKKGQLVSYLPASKITQRYYRIYPNG